MDMGRLQEALADATKAIDMEPRHTRAYLNRGTALYYMGRFQATGTPWRSTPTEQAQLHKNRGLAFQGMGKLSEAVEASTRGRRALARYFLKDYRGCIEDCTQCLKLNANEHDATRSEPRRAELSVMQPDRSKISRRRFRSGNRPRPT